ncbi:PCRF domain-containing protein [Candidatus Vidania fulgoroideae]|uniref:PCRF domain-containing protein n=1 Tax=Candidatus Vidania fulgoroideorum TaxID=881286 RepID=A0A975AE83_9PROT|nr:PCRF domain-containing protein [Candidatus Vidania fulgoroideae]
MKLIIPNSCYIEIKPGPGGKDSKNWALTIAKQYICFAKKTNYRVNIVKHRKDHDFKTNYILLEIIGYRVFEVLKNESGVHKAVRKSIYNKKNKVHTSLCLVNILKVYKIVNNKINRRELRIETFKSRGPGGQSVNKTNSAVRVTHIPSGISVECQRERSQMENKRYAMILLKAKIDKLEEKKLDDEIESNIEDWKTTNRIYFFNKSFVLSKRKKKKYFRIKEIINGDIGKLI